MSYNVIVTPLDNDTGDEITAEAKTLTENTDDYWLIFDE